MALVFKVNLARHLAVNRGLDGKKCKGRSANGRKSVTFRRLRIAKCHITRPLKAVIETPRPAEGPKCLHIVTCAPLQSSPHLTHHEN